MAHRDAKKYPNPGDVLRKFGCTRYVTQVDAKHTGAIVAVHYNDGGSSRTDTKASITAWRGWANIDCEIITTGDLT